MFISTSISDVIILSNKYDSGLLKMTISAPSSNENINRKGVRLIWSDLVIMSISDTRHPCCKINFTFVIVNMISYLQP